MVSQFNTRGSGKTALLLSAAVTLQMTPWMSALAQSSSSPAISGDASAPKSDLKSRLDAQAEANLQSRLEQLGKQDGNSGLKLNYSLNSAAARSRTKIASAEPATSAGTVDDPALKGPITPTPSAFPPADPTPGAGVVTAPPDMKGGDGKTNPVLAPDPTAIKPGNTGPKAQQAARKLTTTIYNEELKIQNLTPGSAAPQSRMPTVQGIANPYAADKTATTPALETINLQKPELKALVTINQQMDPFTLDASSQRGTSLRDVMISSIQHNLTISDARAQTEIQKWGFYNKLTGFLPDATFQDMNFWSQGRITLPGGLGGSGTTSTSAVGGSATPTSQNSSLRVRGPFYVVGGSFTYHLYQGGAVVFGSLQARHQLRAQRATQKATLQDTLLDATRDYYNLVLQQALLQNQIRAVDTDEEQFRINSDLERHGLATYLDVLQAKTQLAKDRQNLIDQQTSRRTASITLADLLNADLGQDLSPAETEIRKVRLVDPNMPIARMLTMAIDNRPELRQYEELRMAAKRAIIVAQSNLHPQVNFGGGVYGVGSSQLTAIYFLNLSVRWFLKGLGTTDLTNTQQARWQARQSLIRANRELVTVLDQVRTACLQSLASERKIEETTEEVASASEELRLAKLRFEHGLGTNLDVLTGQRDLTAAYIDKATAIVNYNIAQVQLLHDLGIVSVDTVTSGRVLQ